MEPDDLLCSRNARSQEALVGHAQWEINQAPSLKKNERAWKDHSIDKTIAALNKSRRPTYDRKT
jgi:hypothetical protein